MVYVKVFTAVTVGGVLGHYIMSILIQALVSRCNSLPALNAPPNERLLDLIRLDVAYIADRRLQNLLDGMESASWLH